MARTYSFVATQQYNKGIISLSKIESSDSSNQLNYIGTRYCQPSNLIPHFWFYKIVDKQGNPDLPCIMILSEVLGWFRCLAKPHIYDNTNKSLPELVGNKLAISYDFLAKKLNFQKERIRRKLVVLETLGLISREIENIALEDGSRINQLFISINPEFYETCFRNPEHDIRVGDTEFCSTDSAVFKRSPLPGGDHISNKNKNRSMKSNFVLYDFEENPMETTQPKSTIETFSTKKITTEKNRADKIEKKEAKKLTDFYPLTEEDCRELQSNSGRKFSLNAMNQILQDMSKRLTSPEFWSKKGFLAYMSKAFSYELRDEVKISNINFQIRNNYSEADKQEKFLSEIESCLQVNPEWHLKKKLAAVLERNTAYNLLKNYKHSERVGGTFKFNLFNEVNLGAMDKQIILNQVKATQEKIDDNGDIEFIEKVEFIYDNKWKENKWKHQKEENNKLNKETDYLAEIEHEIRENNTPIWLKVRKAFIENAYSKEEGIGKDKNWLSKLTVKEVREERRIILDTNSNLTRDWIKNNYLNQLERITKQLGYDLIMIGC